MDISKFVLSDDAIGVIDNGAWVDDLPGAEGVRLLVTGLARNEAAQKAIRTAIESARLSGKTITDDIRASAVRVVMADHVLKGWEGFTQDGKELKYDPSLAKKWLTSRNGEALAELVLAAASRVDNNSASFVEGVTKN